MDHHTRSLVFLVDQQENSEVVPALGNHAHAPIVLLALEPSLAKDNDLLVASLAAHSHQMVVISHKQPG